MFRNSVCEYFAWSSIDPGQTGRQRLKTNLPTLSNPTENPAQKIGFEEQTNIKANIIMWISDFGQIESKCETKYRVLTITSARYICKGQSHDDG